MAYWLGLGINYGHQAPHSPYNSTQLTADLKFLRSMGVGKIRIAYPSFDDATATMAALKNLVQIALAMNFYVVWGTVSSGASKTDATRWAAFKNNTLTVVAPWAQSLSNPHLELSIGNEEELHCDGTTLTTATVVSDMANLATAAQSVYTAGPISYQSPITFLNNWVANGLGGLDRIGFNAYSLGSGIGVLAGNVAAAFPGVGYLSEWGSPNGFADFKNEDFFRTVMKKQVTALKNVGIDAYYFCYRDGSFGLPANAWAVKMTDDNFRTATPVLFGARPWFTGDPNVAIARQAQRIRQPTHARTAPPNRP